MNTSKQLNSNMVKTQTAIFIGIGLFVLGYLVGMGHTIYRSIPPQPASENQHNHPVDMSDMETALIQATKENPQNTEAWIQLGNIYFDAHKYQQAIDAYNKALAVNPKNADVLTDLGVMYRRNKEPQKAVEAFDKAIAIDPTHEMALFNKGIVLMHDLNDSAGAVQAWEELQKINPNATAPNGMSMAELIKQYKQR